MHVCFLFAACVRRQVCGRTAHLRRQHGGLCVRACLNRISPQARARQLRRGCMLALLQRRLVPRFQLLHSRRALALLVYVQLHAPQMQVPCERVHTVSAFSFRRLLVAHAAVLS